MVLENVSDGWEHAFSPSMNHLKPISDEVHGAFSTVGVIQREVLALPLAGYGSEAGFVIGRYRNSIDRRIWSSHL